MSYAHIERKALSVSARLQTFADHLPCLCDVFIEMPLLEWPSSSVDWVHGSSTLGASQLRSGAASHLLLLGESTSGQEGNNILIIRAELPCSSLSGIGNPDADFKVPKSYRPGEVLTTLPHQGDVDRIRSMPQRGNIVATKSYGNAVHVYDIAGAMDQQQTSAQHGATQREASSSADEQPVALHGPLLSSCDSELIPDQGGLCWCPTNEGSLLSTCERGTICIYQLDVATATTRPAPSGPSGQQPGSASGQLSACIKFSGHSGESVNDASFAGKHMPGVFASVGEDGIVCMWDRREGGAPVQQWLAHSRRDGSPCAANSVAFSPLSPSQVATGGADGAIKLWDLRAVGRGSGGASGGGSGVAPMKVLPSHRNTVLQLSWCPHRAGVLASTDVRGLVYVWDVNLGSREEEGGCSEDAVRGGGSGASTSGTGGASRAKKGRRDASRIDPLPKRPELRMIQAGHASEVSDMSWCPDETLGAMVMASVSKAYVEAGEGEEEEEEEILVQANIFQLWRPSLDLF